MAVKEEREEKYKPPYVYTDYAAKRVPGSDKYAPETVLRDSQAKAAAAQQTDVTRTGGRSG